MGQSELSYVEVRPAGSPSHCVIWLHGLGADGYDFAGIERQLALPESLGVRFLYPHAPYRPVTINGGMVMRAWYDVVALDLSVGEDQVGICRSAAALAELVQAVHGEGIPLDRVVLAGFSQGGAIALHTALRMSQRLAGVLVLSSYLPLASSVSSEATAVSRELPILMAHGTDDPVIPLRLARWSCERLRNLGYEVAWREYAMQHGVCEAELVEIHRWLVDTLSSGKVQGPESPS